MQDQPLTLASAAIFQHSTSFFPHFCFSVECAVELFIFTVALVDFISHHSSSFSAFHPDFPPWAQNLDTPEASSPGPCSLPDLIGTRSSCLCNILCVISSPLLVCILHSSPRSFISHRNLAAVPNCLSAARPIYIWWIFFFPEAQPTWWHSSVNSCPRFFS